MNELVKTLRLGAQISRERSLNLDYAMIADRAADAIESLQIEIVGYKTDQKENLKNQCDLVAENQQLRELLNVYNLGGWTDSLTLMKERDALKALSVTNIMIDVVPGCDGMGHEVYAKSIADIENLLTKMGEDLEDMESLKYEMAALKLDAVRYRTVLGMPCDKMLHLYNTRFDLREQFIDVMASKP